MARYEIITPNTGTIVSLAKAKEHVVAEGGFDDVPINDWCLTAQDLLAEVLERSWLPTTWKLYRDTFPAGRRPILIERCPVISVESVEYYDAAGDLVELGEWQADVKGEPARLQPEPGACWPVTECERLNAVQVTFTAGYANVAAVPRMAGQLVKMIMAHWYLHREQVGQAETINVLFGDALLDSLRWQ